MRSFNLIAKPYQGLERLLFGQQLQEARRFPLAYLGASQSALLIGDGDGRFSSELLQIAPCVRIDSIDSSEKMLQLARERAGSQADRLNSFQANALTYPYPVSEYDSIGLQFSLDCLTQPEVDSLVPNLEASLKNGGYIAYADFREARCWHSLVVRALYVAFRIGAGLRADRLPEVNWSDGIRTIATKYYLRGLVFSRLLQKISR